VPSSTFLTSSTVSSSIGLRGFISPRNHVQGSLSRGFPCREAVRARRSPLPSCRSPEAPAPGCPVAPGSRARLQGFAPLASPLRAPDGLGRVLPDPLLSFILPRVLLRTPSSDLHRPSDHGLFRPSSCCQCPT